MKPCFPFFQTKDGHKSDSDQSDYGDWNDDGWGAQEDKQGAGGWDDTGAGCWDDAGADDWGLNEEPKKSATKKVHAFL